MLTAPPATLSAAGSLALLLMQTDRKDEAEQLYRSTLAAYTNNLGADHPEVVPRGVAHALGQPHLDVAGGAPRTRGQQLHR